MKRNKTIEVILTLAICLALFGACNEFSDEFIGDYYHSRQLYPEIVNSEFRNEIVFSINKDGTGFSYLSYESSNKFSHNKNSGKFTWEIKTELNHKLFLIKWENRETTSVILRKGKFGKNILFIVIYDHDIEGNNLQVVGEKMSKKELEEESKIILRDDENKYVNGKTTKIEDTGESKMSTRSTNDKLQTNNDPIILPPVPINNRNSYNVFNKADQQPMSYDELLRKANEKIRDAYSSPGIVTKDMLAAPPSDLENLLTAICNSIIQPEFEDENKMHTTNSDYMNRLKIIINSYNNCIWNENFELLDTILTPNIKRYFNEYNISKSEAINRAKNYKDQFGIINATSKIRWETFKIAKSSNGNYLVDYIEDYSLDRIDKTKSAIFVLHKFFEVNKDFIIEGIYEEILSKKSKQ